MKIARYPFLQIILQATCILFCYQDILANSGISLPDSVNEASVNFRTHKDLIILPVTINDSITVNLILDTGTRNIVLFGKQFRNIISTPPYREVRFNGLGRGRSVTGRVSIHNKLSINGVYGENICLVVVNSRNIFSTIPDVDGVIGYEMFLKLEIEINPYHRRITFRPADNAEQWDGYDKIPLMITDSRPIFSSMLYVDGKRQNRDIFIDTGSSAGLLIPRDVNDDLRSEEIIGNGLNGPISGYNASTQILNPAFNDRSLPGNVISDPGKQHTSLGMAVLRNYVIVINYMKSYVCLKRVHHPFLGRHKRKAVIAQRCDAGNNCQAGS